MKTPSVDEAQSIGQLATLLLLALVVGIAGVVFIMWMMQVWRRSLARRAQRRPARVDDLDPWQLAALRLDASDETADQEPSSDER